ncbi:MAG: hypothetical protein WB660_26580 [Candidatus Sulfotelmatobacter sp.]
MRSAKRLDYSGYMDPWVVPMALARLLAGAFLIAAPAIFHIESSLKDVLIAAGGLVGRPNYNIDERNTEGQRALVGKVAIDDICLSRGG